MRNKRHSKRKRTMACSKVRPFLEVTKCLLSLVKTIAYVKFVLALGFRAGLESWHIETDLENVEMQNTYLPTDTWKALSADILEASKDRADPQSEIEIVLAQFGLMPESCREDCEGVSA